MRITLLGILALAEKQGVALDKLSTDDVLKINKRFGKNWASIFNLEHAMQARKGTGMPSHRNVVSEIKRWASLFS